MGIKEVFLILITYDLPSVSVNPAPVRIHSGVCRQPWAVLVLVCDLHCTCFLLHLFSFLTSISPNTLHTHTPHSLSLSLSRTHWVGQSFVSSKLKRNCYYLKLLIIFLLVQFYTRRSLHVVISMLATFSIHGSHTYCTVATITCIKKSCSLCLARDNLPWFKFCF